MKKSYFLIAALAFLFAACTQSNDYFPEVVESGQPATMLLKLARNGVDNGTRVAGAPNAVDEGKLTNGVVFVFRGHDDTSPLDARQSFDLSDGTTDTVKVVITQGIRYVYVVANVPNISDFDNVSTVADLYDIANKNEYADLTGVALPMSGFTNSVNATTSTIDNPVDVTVNLNYVPSRVHVDWVLPASGQPFSDLVVDTVSILNVKQESDYFNNGTMPLTVNVNKYFRGISDISNFTGSYLPPSTATHTYISDLFTLAANKGHANNYFYLYENGTTAPTIVSIKAHIGDAEYYYPIVINGPENATGGNGTSKIERAHIYYVTATITGPGGTDPYAPISKGCLNVKIVPATWLPVTNITQTIGN